MFIIFVKSFFFFFWTYIIFLANFSGLLGLKKSNFFFLFFQFLMRGVVVQWLKPSLQIRIHWSWVQICTLLQFSELHCTYHSACLDSTNGWYGLVADLWITFQLKLHRTRVYKNSKFLNVLFSFLQALVIYIFYLIYYVEKFDSLFNLYVIYVLKI